MRKKVEDYAAKRAQEMKDKVEEYSCVTPHDPECPFYSEEKTCNMCLLMKKSCVSVPTLMCQNMQKAWSIGYDDGESGERFAEEFRALLKKANIHVG